MWWDPGFDDPNASDAKSKSRTNRFWTGSEKRILDIQINISPNSREDGQILHYRMQDEEKVFVDRAEQVGGTKMSPALLINMNTYTAPRKGWCAICTCRFVTVGAHLVCIG